MNRKVLILLALILITACSTSEEIKMAKLRITSPDFKNNETIPSKFTCDGKNINPELNFYGIPSKTKSLVLIMDDPDAPSGTWAHWVLFNIPPTIAKIEENTNAIEADLGKTSWRKLKYGGPCPPNGEHRYFFRLYALDSTIDLEEPTREELLEEIESHIIEKAELIGLYERK